MFVTPSQSMPISINNESLGVQSQLPIIRSTSLFDVDSSSIPIDQSSTSVFSFSVIMTKFSTTATTNSKLLTMTPAPTVPVSIQSDFFNGKLDVLLNDSAIISFTITGGFPLIEPRQINWSFMGHRNDTFIPIETNALSEDRLSLMIERVELENSGIYKVSVTNEAGTVESTTLLHVIVKAKLLEIVHDGSLIVKGKGEFISFNCTADGISLPLITWRRNGQLITSNARRKMQSSGISEGLRSSIIPGVMQITSTLTITDLNENDNGNYSCRADNEAQIGDTSVLPYSLQLCQLITAVVHLVSIINSVIASLILITVNAWKDILEGT
uniref:Ig-like domain-containing protein n=1 Tax=Amphimedon queenslandica TaxID=400682 RepID=A0A1X7SXV5_AMPQE